MTTSASNTSHVAPAGAGEAGPHVQVALELASASALPMFLVFMGERAPYFNQACLAFGLGDESGTAWATLRETAGDTIAACLQGSRATFFDLQLGAPGAGTAKWCNLYFTPIGAQGEAAAALCVLVDTTDQVLAQQRLEVVEAEARKQAAAFSIVYSNMEEVAFLLTHDSAGQFRFSSVNDAFCAETGLAREEVVGKLVQEVIPEPSSAIALGHYREAIAGRRTVRWDDSATYATGQKVASMSATPVFDAEGRCTDLIGTAHDITELKRVEEQLRAANADLEQLAATLRVSEERLGFALESAGEGVWDWDVVHNQMFFSKRWKEILGVGADAPDDFNFWWNRMHPDDVASARESLRACLTGTDQVCVNTHRLWHESGRWIWVQTRGSVVERDPQGMARRMVGTIVDISATTELRQELERSYDLLAKLAQQVPGVLFELVLRPDGKLSCPFVSAMSDELFQRSPREIVGNIKSLLSRIYWRDRAHLRHSMRESASRLQPWRAEFRVELPANRLCWRELTAKPARMADGSVVWHGFTTDITERKRTEETIREFNEKLERRAHYDALTGVPNRLLFRDRLEQEMKHAGSDSHGMALLFIDLDRFKEVNDLLGHDAGDALLAHAARRIARCLRPGDTLARLGGDEFTVILTGTAEVKHAEETAQKIIDVLRAPFRIGIEQVIISASIGVTLYPGDGDHPEELMRNADHAMYRSKAAGRNRLSFFEPAMQVAAMRRLKLTNELRRAVAEGQLELHFQPIIDTRTGQITKAEALLRWRRPGKELAMPAEFVGIAEETGLIHDIGNWVFFQAANWSQRWSAMLGQRFQISINKSPVQFQSNGHTAKWIEYLERQRMPHHSIAVEITEGVLLNITDGVFNKLHELQEGGVEVSIDDFGTGYSSMSYLKRLEIDYLKIDRSFVAGMLQDRTSQTIAETIIVMAHKLGLKAIAEGVETEPQRVWLAEHGCDYVQGFLFGQPVDPARFERLLARQAGTLAVQPSAGEGMH
jgi:diguanylate cyclase (GGDEF)-like protein/PAS domain S-box-containing protein